jgi:hypothetical protein
MAPRPAAPQSPRSSRSVSSITPSRASTGSGLRRTPHPLAATLSRVPVARTGQLAESRALMPSKRRSVLGGDRRRQLRHPRWSLARTVSHRACTQMARDHRTCAPRAALDAAPEAHVNSRRSPVREHGRGDVFREVVGHPRWRLRVVRDAAFDCAEEPAAEKSDPELQDPPVAASCSVSQPDSIERGRSTTSETRAIVTSSRSRAGRDPVHHPRGGELCQHLLDARIRAVGEDSSPIRDAGGSVWGHAESRSHSSVASLVRELVGGESCCCI